MPNEDNIVALGPQPSARAQAAAKAAEMKATTGKNYRINTTPYYSTLILAVQMSNDQLPTSGTPLFFFGKLMPQTASAFNYRIGDEITDQFSGIMKRSTRADTNLNEPFQTVSDEDLAFEAIALSYKSARVAFATAPTGLTDATIRDAFLGKVQLVDVSGFIHSSQIGSPFNLQNNLDQLVRNKVSAQLVWGGKTNVPLGTCDYLHDNTSRSYLQAAGIPASANVFKMPEGHNWEGQGSDSQLEVQFKVEEPAAIALSAVTLPGDSTPTKPAWVLLEYKVTLLGAAFRPLGRNG